MQEWNETVILEEAKAFAALMTQGDPALALWVGLLFEAGNVVEEGNQASLQAGRDACFALQGLARAAGFPALTVLFYSRYELFCGKLADLVVS